MSLTTNDVKHIAKLSRIELTENELEKFRTQLSSILGYIEKLNEVDTSEVPPTINTTGIQNRMRPDEIEESLPQEEALKNSKQTSEGFFIVPNVFE